MRKYTRRQKNLIIAATQKARLGFVPFFSWLSSLPEKDREYLEKRFNIKYDERVKV